MLKWDQYNTLQLPGLKVKTGAELRTCWGVREGVQRMDNLKLGSCHLWRNNNVLKSSPF